LSGDRDIPRRSISVEPGVVGDISPPVTVDPENVGEEGEIRSPVMLTGTCKVGSVLNGTSVADRASLGSG